MVIGTIVDPAGEPVVAAMVVEIVAHRLSVALALRGMGWWERRVLPRLVDRCCGMADFDKLRAPTCAGLHGQVLELGFGSGLNVAHYPAAVTRVTAVEPSDLAWRLGAPRVCASGVEVVRGGLDGARLDAEDASYDGVLSTFTLCTIPDVEAALAEVRRVLKPGGRLHFVEHGLAPDDGVVRWQRRLEPVQRLVAGGCRLSRPIRTLVEQAGLETGPVSTFYGSGPRSFSHFYLGTAQAR